MGQINGLPVGLLFMGTAWSEPKLIEMAYAYEQRTRTAPAALRYRRADRRWRAVIVFL